LKRKVTGKDLPSS